MQQPQVHQENIPRLTMQFHDLKLHIVNDRVDPTFSFMTLDRDGKIRMDCSSPYAMASLVDLRNQYDIAFGNDTDFDRHGIVTSSWGLLNPNHYLSVAISYLFTERGWGERAAIGKTLVSSAMIDRVAKRLNEILPLSNWRDEAAPLLPRSISVLRPVPSTGVVGALDGDWSHCVQGIGSVGRHCGGRFAGYSCGR